MRTRKEYPCRLSHGRRLLRFAQKGVRRGAGGSESIKGLATIATVCGCKLVEDGVCSGIVAVQAVKARAFGYEVCHYECDEREGGTDNRKGAPAVRVDDKRK